MFLDQECGVSWRDAADCSDKFNLVASRFAPAVAVPAFASGHGEAGVRFADRAVTFMVNVPVFIRTSLGQCKPKQLERYIHDGYLRFNLREIDIRHNCLPL